MALDQEIKQDIISKYQRDPKDTGSTNSNIKCTDCKINRSLKRESQRSSFKIRSIKNGWEKKKTSYIFKKNRFF